MSDIGFVIAPIGNNDSAIRRSTDGLIRAAVRPVLEACDLDVVVAHEISEPGSITQQVIEHLLTANVVIANLTGLNANVMYEVGLAHRAQKPVILLTQVGESTERAMALEEGADDYLNKPFDPHELVARIHAVLRRARPGVG